MNYPFYDNFTEEVFYPESEFNIPKIGDVKLIYNEESKKMDGFEFTESGEWVKV